MPNKLSVGAGLFVASLALPDLSVAGEVSVPERPELRMQIDACLLAPDTMVALRNVLLREHPAFRSIYCVIKNPAELTVALAPSRNDDGSRMYSQEEPTDTAVVSRIEKIILERERNFRSVHMLLVWGTPRANRMITVSVQ